VNEVAFARKAWWTKVDFNHCTKNQHTEVMASSAEISKPALLPVFAKFSIAFILQASFNLLSSIELTQTIYGNKIDRFTMSKIDI
jgi:hypothetical protein